MEPLFYGSTEYLSIFKTIPQGYYSNSYPLGGWVVRTKQYEDFKTRASVEELPRDLIDNENVYFVADKKINNYTLYFYQTYGIPVRYEVCAFVDDIFIMRIHSTTLDQMGAITDG